MDFQFAAAVNEQTDDDTDGLQPIPFTLNVTDLDEDGEPLEEQRYEQDDHTYLCQIPSAELMSMIMSDANGGELVAQASTVWLFFENTLSTEDYRRLRQRSLQKAITGIRYEHLVQVMMGLIKGFTGFPTKPSSASSPSPKATGRRSTGRQPGPGSTRSRSAAVAG